MYENSFDIKCDLVLLNLLIIKVYQNSVDKKNNYFYDLNKKKEV